MMPMRKMKTVLLSTLMLAAVLAIAPKADSDSTSIDYNETQHWMVDEHEYFDYDAYEWVTEYGKPYNYENHTLIWEYDDNSECYVHYCPKCDYYEYSGVEYFWNDNTLYSSSKNIKVSFYGAVYRGDVINVKIGGKKYKYTIPFTDTDRDYREFNIKIKKPKKKQKITLTLTHGGKVTATHTEYVCISKNPKKGMTKKTVTNYTPWGSPYRTSSSSGGYSYWFYRNGSSITFKKGKVVYWYKA